MKRFTLIATLLLCATIALGQEKKEPAKAEEFNSVRDYRTKIFEIHHRDPRSLSSSLGLLGSGFKGAGISVNQEMRTITVRDFPENIAAIEEAIKRLDRAVAAAPDIEVNVTVLLGSQTPLKEDTIPEGLAPVVKQLRSTLRYSSYGLLASTLHRTKAGRGLDGSGVADAALLGMKPNQERPLIYHYKLREISTAGSPDRAGIEIESFEFSMNVPLSMGDGQVQYQQVGFQTPVTIRQNEKVVIGTTTMGDKALIVVVTASVH